MLMHLNRFSALLVAGIMSATVVQAGSVVTVGTAVDASRQVSMDAIDHRPLDTLLRKYVDANGNVDYRAWHASTPDRAALDQYLKQLSAASASIKAAPDSQLAYWINAYNAVTIQGILREYPTSSIRNHTARVFGYNIWQDLKLHVGDRLYALEEIEHRVLRRTGDPRIHFAIVCASRGCPRLLNQAYTADRVQQLLQANTIDFFAREQNFRHDAKSNRIYLSTVLKWFSEDFGRDQASVLKRIAPWLPNEAARRSAQTGRVRVSYLPYDWSLNEPQSHRSARLE